jgi:hypothetical protein
MHHVTEVRQILRIKPDMCVYIYIYIYMYLYVYIYGYLHAHVYINTHKHSYSSACTLEECSAKDYCHSRHPFSYINKYIR